MLKTTNVEMINMNEEQLKSFDLLHNIDEFSSEVLMKLSVNKSSYQELTASALYQRCYSFYKTIFLTVHQGFPSSAKVLLRSAMESMFWLVAISYDESWAEKYVFQDELARLKSYNKAKLITNDDLRKEVLKSFPNDFSDTLKQKIKEKSIQRISIEQVAKASKITDWYHTGYSVLSSSIHSSSRDIESNFIVNDDKDIVGIKVGPDFTDYDSICIGACETMFHSLLAVERTFHIPTAEFVGNSMDAMDIVFPKS